jgi:uncharacterized protein (DUF433 family)
MIFPMTTTAINHIIVDERGVAWIDATNVKVLEVAADRRAHQSSPEEMHLQYPHLSVAQICAALTYYYDHQVELDAQLDEQMEEYSRLRQAAPASPGLLKLRKQGLL